MALFDRLISLGWQIGVGLAGLWDVVVPWIAANWIVLAAFWAILALVVGACLAARKETRQLREDEEARARNHVLRNAVQEALLYGALLLYEHEMDIQIPESEEEA